MGLWRGDRLLSSIEAGIADLLHPLPQKRFVALLHWPPTPDATLKPLLSGVIDAIAGELARAEAYDHNLFIAAQRTEAPLLTPAQLNEVRESLGANLILAASATAPGNSQSSAKAGSQAGAQGVAASYAQGEAAANAQGNAERPLQAGSEKGQIELTLRVLTPSLGEPLRQIRLRIPRDRQSELSERAVQAAARLLNVARYSPDDQRSRPSTDSPEALAVYQSAEALRKQPNDTGLDAAIEKYKQAIELDPRYAAAYARLARAYFRLYDLRGDSAALAISRANCQSALSYDPNSVEGHVVLGEVFERTGDSASALGEIKKALSIDPSNANTLLSQARFYCDEARWSEAEDALTAVIKVRPNHWLPHHELGTILSRAGNYHQALAEFQAAALLSPSNAQAFANLGDTYLQLGKVAEALQHCGKSYALQPNAQAAMLMAEAWRVQGSYQLAIEYAKTAVRLGPIDAENWVELADCYSSSSQGKAAAHQAYAKAQSVQEERLPEEPKDGPGWMRLALCRVKVGSARPVLPILARADALHADDMMSQLLRVRILELLGRRNEALSCLAKCAIRGATAFQIAILPDGDALRSDPLYSRTMGPKALFAKTKFQTRS